MIGLHPGTGREGVWDKSRCCLSYQQNGQKSGGERPLHWWMCGSYSPLTSIVFPNWKRNYIICLRRYKMPAAVSQNERNPRVWEWSTVYCKVILRFHLRCLQLYFCSIHSQLFKCRCGRDQGLTTFNWAWDFIGQVQRRQNEQAEAICKEVVKMCGIKLSKLHDKESMDVIELMEVFIDTVTLRLGILGPMN